MSRVAPNWDVFIDKPKQQLGRKGNAMYNHVYYRWTQFSYRPASSVDEDSPFASPHKKRVQSPGSFGARPTGTRSPDQSSS